MNAKEITKTAVKYTNIFGKKIACLIKNKNYKKAEELLKKFKEILEKGD